MPGGPRILGFVFVTVVLRLACNNWMDVSPEDMIIRSMIRRCCSSCWISGCSSSDKAPCSAIPTLLGLSQNGASDLGFAFLEPETIALRFLSQKWLRTTCPLPLMGPEADLYVFGHSVQNTIIQTKRRGLILENSKGKNSSGALCAHA